MVRARLSPIQGIFVSRWHSDCSFPTFESIAYHYLSGIFHIFVHYFTSCSPAILVCILYILIYHCYLHLTYFTEHRDIILVGNAYLFRIFCSPLLSSHFHLPLWPSLYMYILNLRMDISWPKKLCHLFPVPRRNLPLFRHWLCVHAYTTNDGTYCWAWYTWFFSCGYVHIVTLTGICAWEINLRA